MLCGAIFLSKPLQAAEKPNIVFILIDDMGWPDVVSYGHKFHETPNIDRLAKQGVRFTDFYAACPVCSPTRASIQSGQYQARFHLTDFIPGHWRPYEKLVVPFNAPELPLEIPTLAEGLKPAGYKTGYFGKWHLGGPTHNPDKQGYDVSLVTGGRHFAPNFRTTPKVEVEQGAYLADFLTDQTIQFIKDNKDGPFFVQLSHYAVHIPLEAKPGQVKKYTDKPKPETGVNNPIYAAMVAHVDQSVGKIMQALQEFELAKNTVVVFTSDNGGLRERYDGGDIVSTNAPLRDEKGTLYEGGIRVPLIVRWPGVAKRGTVCAEPTISVDFYPTFLEIAGTEKPKGHTLDGKSLVPLLNNPNSQLDREAIYFHYPHYHHSRPAGVIRTRDWKLVEFFEHGDLELYNLKDDLSETTNLAEKNSEKAKELQGKLIAWRNSVGALLPTKNPEYDAERAHEWRSRRTKKPRGKRAVPSKK